MRYTVHACDNHQRWCKEGTDIVHREDGPAIEATDGTKYWYINDVLHREDGPAFLRPDGAKMWYINGKLHREDGPAIMWADGSRFWYVNDKRHREDGPAVERADGWNQWFIEGVELTEQQFLERTAPAKELTVAEIEQLLGYRVKIVK